MTERLRHVRLCHQVKRAQRRFRKSVKGGVDRSGGRTGRELNRSLGRVLEVVRFSGTT